MSSSEHDPGRGDFGGLTGPDPTPALPADPPEPAQSSGPAQSSEPAQPAEPAQAAGPAQPAEPAEPAQPAEPAEPAQPEPAQPDEPTERPPRPRGRMSYQDENTTPREPTLAEQRAHQQAERKTAEDERARLAEEARKAKIRKRVLIGGGAAAGVAALIAVGYASSEPEPVQARCVGPDNVVVDDSNCVRPAAGAANGSYGGGGFYGGGFFPIFIGGGNRQYHYNYGGGGGIGQTVQGGTTTVPKNATVTSGTSGRTIQRGGFGVSSRGSGGRSGGFGSGS